METLNQVVAVSGKDNSKIHVKFDQIKLNKPTSVAVHSYSHGDCKTYTINDTNHAIDIQMHQYSRADLMTMNRDRKEHIFGQHGDLPEYDEEELEKTTDMFQRKVIHIPHGEYKTSADVLDAIYDAIHDYYKQISWYSLKEHPAQGHLGHLIREYSTAIKYNNIKYLTF